MRYRGERMKILESVRRYRLAWSLFALVCLVPLSVVVLALARNEGRQPAEFVQAGSISQAFPGARINWVGSGTFSVPIDAPPGQYMVTATGNTFGCSWVRLRRNNLNPNSVIDSGTVNRGSFAQFQILTSDKYVKMLGDCTWAVSQ